MRQPCTSAPVAPEPARRRGGVRQLSGSSFASFP